MPVRNDRLSARLTQWTNGMIRLESWIAVLLLVILLVTMGAQVIARYFWRAPFSWSEELARLAMIWMTFIAAALVMARQGHIAVNLWDSGIGRRLPKRFHHGLECAVSLIVFLTCLLLLLGGLRFVWHVHPVGSPALGIPKSLWYGAVSVGLGLMALHSLLQLVLNLRAGYGVKSADSMESEQ